MKRYYGLLTLILAGIITITAVTYSQFPSATYKSYDIRGNITYSDGAQNKSQIVYAYYPYYDIEHLYRSTLIQTNKINWINNFSGTFEIFFTVPIGLTKIVITANPSSCDHKEIDLTKISSPIELFSSINECKKERIDDIVGDLNRIRTSLDIMETELGDKQFTPTEIQNIKDDIKKSRDGISEAGLANNNNESVLQAYYAEWFSWKAQYRLDLTGLKHCLDELTVVFGSHGSDKCYVPGYSAYKDYISSNLTFYALGESRVLKDLPYGIRNIEGVKQGINSIKQERTSLLLNAYTKCENALDEINQTFEYEKPYCDWRKISVGFSYLIWAIALIYFGILIGVMKKLWLK